MGNIICKWKVKYLELEDKSLWEGNLLSTMLHIWSTALNTKQHTLS